jgi:hypothetical protein
MKLAELRKLSIRKQFKIHFRLQNGMECIISEHGIAQVPALKGVPDFNLEEELATATTFLVEPAVVPDKKADKKNITLPRSVSREEMIGMTSATPASSSAAEHDDE